MGFYVCRGMLSLDIISSKADGGVRSTNHTEMEMEAEKGCSVRWGADDALATAASPTTCYRAVQSTGKTARLLSVSNDSPAACHSPC